MTPKPQQQAHTPGPWRNCDVASNFAQRKKFIRPVASEALIATVGGEWRLQEIWANARLITAASNSYNKHCGTRAVECAEADLLGEALAALRVALPTLEHRATTEARANKAPTGLKPSTEHRDIWQAARAVLAKASGDRT